MARRTPGIGTRFHPVDVPAARAKQRKSGRSHPGPENNRRIRARPELQDNLRASFCRMLRFYGLELEEDVRRGANFEERAGNWLSPWNHNHLRITRILKSLRILGLEKEASLFFNCLAQIYATH